MAKIYNISLQKQNNGIYRIYIKENYMGSYNKETDQISLVNEMYDKILNKKANIYYEKRMKNQDMENPQSYINIWFLKKILELSEDEKEYKKFVNRGYKIVTITEYPEEIYSPVPIPETFASLDEESHKIAEKWIKEKKKEWPNLIIKTYKNLNDFYISI